MSSRTAVTSNRSSVPERGVSSSSRNYKEVTNNSRRPQVLRPPRLRPPPSERVFGELPSKGAMLDVLHGSTALAVSISPGTQPFIPRQGNAEGLTALSNRALIQLGLRAQQSWRTDSVSMASLVKGAIEQSVRKTLSEYDKEWKGPASSLSDEDLVRLAVTVKQEIADQAMSLARDMDELMRLSRRKEALVAGNEELEKSILALSEELEEAEATRKKLEKCDKSAEQILQKRSVKTLKEKIAAEEEKVEAATEEIKRKKCSQEESLAKIQDIHDQLKALMKSLAPPSQSSISEA